MAITTAGFYQKNIDLFSRLNKDVSDIQVQVSTGKKTLSLKHDVQDIALLNASEEHKQETTQFNSNAGRVISDLEKIDISFEQLQNAAIRLKELQVESSNGLLTGLRNLTIESAPIIPSDKAIFPEIKLVITIVIGGNKDNVNV